MFRIAASTVDRLATPHRNAMAIDFTNGLKDVHPETVAPLGFDRAYELVVGEMKAGMALGLTARSDLYRYVNLSALLGWQYRGTPEFGWVHDMMSDQSFGDASDRLAQIYGLLSV
jgi:hypothetical protein